VKGSPFGAGTHCWAVAVDPTGKFLYAANKTSNDISAYTINATSGALTPVKGSPFGAGRRRGPIGVAVDPTGKFLYLTNYRSNDVSAYTINAISGALKRVKGSPFGGGQVRGPTLIATCRVEAGACKPASL
jgi:6-phosphogluconolactonase